MGEQTAVSRAEKVLATNLGDEIVMMDLESGAYFNMKDTALRIWDLIETPATLGALIDTLSTEYDVDRETCAKDVKTFIAELQGAEIVVLS
ncbi:PqqD family peptide modification chaperone [Anianabacter salinae]|uniref:PqqD family peptide modification chaperone n=1 Tax=Anianabacter salinae TaxID=2851023 RepID=UPI00225E602C|nr:PqqD family peptide modification chaperone [Anianabacter salinae]MBV0913039.1 PqqD family peptide modification chaperone [Anianabacter salinae]